MRLSFCIPTYNRAPQLRQLLESVARQAGHDFDVEVVVSDNASTDDTPAVIEEFTRAGLSIVYRRLSQNLGFDRNMLAVVGLAGGDYCWLFGSDDKLEDGAFARLAQALARHPDATGVSVGSNGYSTDLSRRIAYRDHISADFPRETVLHGRDAIVEGIGPWGMGYISAVIVRRHDWEAAVASSPTDDYLNGYIHIYVLGRALGAESCWVCVPDRLVGWRSGNDSATSRTDAFKRTRLDIIGFDQSFAGALGRRNRAYRATMRKVATFYIRSHFVTATMNRAGMGYWRQAIPMSVARYWRYPSFWLKTLPIAFMPRPVLKALQTAKARTKREPGSGR